MKILRVGAIVCIAWFAAAALTPITSVAIRNSTMDSTAIGNTTPSSAKLTVSQVTTPVTSTPTQGGYFGWNGQVSGETDFVNRQGSGIGGFSWFNTNTTTPGSAIMNLSPGGTLSGSTSLFSQSGAISQYAAGSTVNAGWIDWGQTGVGGTNLGEMDFIAESASGTGGFNWYNTHSSSLPGSPIARMDGSGNLSLASVSASTFTGALTGNASSANVLNSSVANCAATLPAVGIQTNGNANCGAFPSSAASTGYATLPGGIIIEWGQTGTYDTGPVSTSLAKTFPHACLQATVGSVFTGGSRISSLVSCSTTSITVENDGSGVTSFTVIGW